MRQPIAYRCETYAGIPRLPIRIAPGITQPVAIGDVRRVVGGQLATAVPVRAVARRRSKHAATHGKPRRHHANGRRVVRRTRLATLQRLPQRLPQRLILVLPGSANGSAISAA